MDKNKILIYIEKKLGLLKGKTDETSQAVQATLYYLQLDILEGKFDKERTRRG